MSPGSLGRPFGKPGVEAPTADQAARFDRISIWERGVPESALMENAGRQAALIVQHLYPEGEVVALAGSGNNGGDALVCARALSAWGRRVSVVAAGNRPSSDPVLHGWKLPTTDFDLQGPCAPEKLAGHLGRASVLVDGLLGTGIRGAPRAVSAAVIRAANRAPGAVVALDAPSGVDGSNGRVPGTAVRAQVTVAFGWPKLGTLLYPGRGHCGRIVAVEIGFPPERGEGWAQLITPGWASEALPRRSPVTHKHAAGALAVVAGSAMPGAAVLAARAAFRCGVGLVRVCAARSVREVVLSVPEVLFVDAGDASALSAAVRSSDAVALGPGLGTGPEAERQLTRVLEIRGSRPAVLDADALTLLARGAAGGLEALAGGPAVVTPHPGEMARLTGRTPSEVQKDRVSSAAAFAASWGVVTVLKGAPSLVAVPGGGLFVSTLHETSSLAVAGMGDVLTGATGAFLSQGKAPPEAAGLALEITGRAASFGFPRGSGAALIPSDVVDRIGSVLARRGRGTTDLPFPFVTFDQDPPR